MTKLESTVTTIPLRSTKKSSFSLSSGWISSGHVMLALPALLATSIAFGAQSDPGDYERLLNEANSKGVASVLVTLDDTVTLEEMGSSLDSVKAEMESKAEVLLAELGEYALTEGYWNNGIGQIGLYVNAKGLQVLANSANAVSFSFDDARTYRIRAYDDDGSLDAIESIINEKGFANVEVFLNVDEGDYDIDRKGKTVFKPSSALLDQIASRLNNIKTHKFAKSFKNFDVTPSLAAIPNPSFRVRIDRNTFYGLRESEDVRAIRPVGFVDPRQAQWPADVLETAQANGSAEVIITLRGGSVFSTKAGSMSAKALKAQAGANQRTFDDILVDADTSTSAVLASYADIGAIHARLPYDSLKRLYKKADSRILSIELNRPVAEATLTNSTGLMNMQSAWNAGYRAAGQSIIIVDSGIRKDHELFKMNGATKVTYEACFGTDAGGYSSICPSKDIKGDSPLGLSGSGEPNSDLTGCSTFVTKASAGYHDCSHGTHVAGIVAGRKSPSVSPSNLQGVAPDAGLISAQVYSYDKKNYKVNAFNADILAVLDAVLSATTASTNNPYVVNLSMAGNQIYSGDCGSLTDTQKTYESIKNAIKSLTDRGVPIVTPTGNYKSHTGLSWPACVPHTIKVSSVANDAYGTDLSEFANIGNPASFTGPILLAPGGGWKTSIKSADRASTTATKGIAGTSQAAPHVSGVYAAIKAAVPGISVADATNWIVNTGSIPVTVDTKTYRRIRIPNF